MESQRVIYFKFKVTFIFEFISFNKSKQNFVFKKYISSLKKCRNGFFCFVHSNNLAVSTSEKQFILKNIFSEEESEEGDEFHVSQK